MFLVQGFGFGSKRGVGKFRFKYGCRLQGKRVESCFMLRAGRGLASGSMALRKGVVGGKVCGSMSLGFRT